jgi:hypothetical protein
VIALIESTIAVVPGAAIVIGLVIFAPVTVLTRWPPSATVTRTQRM